MGSPLSQVIIAVYSWAGSDPGKPTVINKPP